MRLFAEVKVSPDRVLCEVHEHVREQHDRRRDRSGDRDRLGKEIDDGDRDEKAGRQ
jgi:hypothetical protein